MPLQERLDSLEKRVMAKMDRAVQHCLAEQGLGPEAALPQVHARLQGVEDALQSVLAGRGSRADQRRSARMLKVGRWPLFNVDVCYRWPLFNMMSATSALSVQAICSMRTHEGRAAVCAGGVGLAGTPAAHTKRGRARCLLQGCATRHTQAAVLPAPLDAPGRCDSALHPCQVCSVSLECTGQERACQPLYLKHQKGFGLHAPHSGAALSGKDTCRAVVGQGRPHVCLREEACGFLLPIIKGDLLLGRCCAGYGQPAEGLPPGAEQSFC